MSVFQYKQNECDSANTMLAQRPTPLRYTGVFKKRQNFLNSAPSVLVGALFKKFGVF
jgi:hypothetical protein